MEQLIDLESPVWSEDMCGTLFNNPPTPHRGAIAAVSSIGLAPVLSFLAGDGALDASAAAELRLVQHVAVAAADLPEVVAQVTESVLAVPAGAMRQTVELLRETSVPSAAPLRELWR